MHPSTVHRVAAVADKAGIDAVNDKMARFQIFVDLLKENRKCAFCTFPFPLSRLSTLMKDIEGSPHCHKLNE